MREVQKGYSHPGGIAITFDDDLYITFPWAVKLFLGAVLAGLAV